MKTVWQLQEAKSRFSELVERAIKQGAQTVTKHGKAAVVVVSAEETSAAGGPANPSLQHCGSVLRISPSWSANDRRNRRA
jgi:prevent-host-death family protein